MVFVRGLRAITRTASRYLRVQVYYPTKYKGKFIFISLKAHFDERTISLFTGCLLTHENEGRTVVAEQESANPSMPGGKMQGEGCGSLRFHPCEEGKEGRMEKFG